MKKATVSSVFILLTCLFNFAFAQAVVDADLQNALNSNPTTAYEVIVTFHGENAPTASDIAVLQQAGIAPGVTLDFSTVRKMTLLK